MTHLFTTGVFALTLFAGSIALAAEERHQGHAGGIQHGHAMSGDVHHHGADFHHHGYGGGDEDNGGGFYCGPAQIALGLCNLGD
jgi:hypothetical protein